MADLGGVLERTAVGRFAFDVQRLAEERICAIEVSARFERVGGRKHSE